MVGVVRDRTCQTAVAHRDLAAGERALLGQRLARGGGLFDMAEDVDGQAILHGLLSH